MNPWFHLLCFPNNSIVPNRKVVASNFKITSIDTIAILVIFMLLVLES